MRKEMGGSEEEEKGIVTLFGMDGVDHHRMGRGGCYLKSE